MPIAEHVLREALETAFPDAQTILIEDLAGDDDHWSVTLISEVFTGQSRIARHKMVQQAVSAYDIHALSIRTTTPEESGGCSG